MSKSILALTLAGLLAIPVGISAQDDAKKSADGPVADVIKDAIDPYVPGKERARFLKAAGVDTELDADEFKTNAAQKDSFVRKYDKWSAILAFDKNNDKNIDWFEANSYRKGIQLYCRILGTINEHEPGRPLFPGLRPGARMTAMRRRGVDGGFLACHT